MLLINNFPQMFLSLCKQWNFAWNILLKVSHQERFPFSPVQKCFLKKMHFSRVATHCPFCEWTTQASVTQNCSSWKQFRYHREKTKKRRIINYENLLLFSFPSVCHILPFLSSMSNNFSLLLNAKQIQSNFISNLFFPILQVCFLKIWRTFNFLPSVEGFIWWNCDSIMVRCKTIFTTIHYPMPWVVQQHIFYTFKYARISSAPYKIVWNGAQKN